MRHLTDQELFAHANAQLDPMFSTELERELLRRLEQTIGVEMSSEEVEAIVGKIGDELAAIRCDRPRGLSNTIVTDAITKIDSLVADLAAIALEAV